MKEKGATFFLFLLFIIIKGFNKTRKIVGELKRHMESMGFSILRSISK